MKRKKYVYLVVSNWTGNTVFESFNREEAETRMRELNTRNYYKGKMYELFEVEKVEILI